MADRSYVGRHRAVAYIVPKREEIAPARVLLMVILATIMLADLFLIGSHLHPIRTAPAAVIHTHVVVAFWPTVNPLTASGASGLVTR